MSRSPIKLRFEVLVAADPNERSSSWSQRVWIHQRRLAKIPGGTSVVDELEFEPRVAFAAPFLRWFITRIFMHRHWRLQARFGVADG